jgi:hypothetical protein
MSSPDVIDERFDELVRELRSAPPVAPPALRERVREIAARPPVRERRFRLTWVLAPAAAAAAGAIAIGVLSSGGDRPQQLASPGARGTLNQADMASTSARASAPVPLGASATPVPPGKRAQLYTASITLRVRDLSARTQQALRITRGLGGYLRVVDYGEGARRGTADLVLRVPIGRVQQAIVRFSQLGTILDQQVRVRDVQPRLDRRFRRIAELQRTIPALQGDALAVAQAELEALRTAQAGERRRASFATVSLHLRTKDAGAALPEPPSRIERALERAADVLAAELVAVIYALVVAAPFIVLLFGVFAFAKRARRRNDGRLLA